MNQFVLIAALPLLLLMMLACPVKIPAQGAATPQIEQDDNQDGYTLVWADEFDADGPPNPDNWIYDGEGFVRNHELQWYQQGNAFCRDGRLIIEARRERRPNPMYVPGSPSWERQREHIEYTSSILSTRGKHTWTFGRFEIRAKVDTAAGLWPAIWMLGYSGREWPACGEIDIMEYYRGRIMANAAWARPGDYRPKWDSSETFIKDLPDHEGWADRFHVWRMDWTPQYIRIYMDDQLLNEVDLSKTLNETPDGANPFHDPHYLLLNLALGGDNGGDPSGTQLPRRFIVDYVRVYQKVPQE